MIVAIRVRGSVKMNRNTEKTLEVLGLKKVNTAILIDDSKKSVLKKLESFITWGEASDEAMNLLRKKSNLNPPKGGYKSIKKYYPKGALGYRGEAINDLIKRMIVE